MTANKKRSTYRITPELDRIITQQAEKLGISKNAYLQITLAEALEHVDDRHRIITRVPRKMRAGVYRICFDPLRTHGE